ncbi:hypothetical protein EN978_07185 [Mesorhizobium sp. M7A.F.Ca.US.001.04.1.1]|uniref:hypothetical protein n=1 Tax=unclassified Mesorhizobium TaxID=325217 RepID=UPI000FCB9F45|nr:MULTISPECIES: hypothetical protein [unclassified Mesorhizobium]RUY31703.1 hypothetical protein EN979_02095 [Mesorhizobium sp. M7A.F.Ca.US.001.04.2.1]RUY44109.1 hypothetical protein EN978_07185 [Mesorhizobium sp. M7A.F.Ca.US.001.04.1.1]
MQTTLYFVIRNGSDGDWRHPFATTDLGQAEREAARRAAEGYQVKIEAWPVGVLVSQPNVVREFNAA